MPGAHVRPTPARVRIPRVVVGVLIVATVAAAGVRAALDEPPGDRISATRSTAGADPTSRAAPEVGQDRLDEVRREWFLLPQGAMPPRAAMPEPALPTSDPPGPTTPPGPTAATTAAPASSVPAGAVPEPPRLPLPPGWPSTGDRADDEAREVPPAFDDLRPTVPARALAAYRSAAATLRATRPACRLDWALLAAIGTVESDHGRFGGARLAADGTATPPILGIRLDGSRSGTATIRDSDGGRLDGDTVYDRAVGPMQFLPGTWAAYGRSATPGKSPDPQDIDDAALSAGSYLCAGGRDVSDAAGRRAAVLAYNPSDSYAATVIALARALADGSARSVTPPPVTSPPAPPPVATTPTPSPTTTPTPSTPTPPTPTTTTPTPTNSPTPTTTSPTTPDDTPTVPTPTTDAPSPTTGPTTSSTDSPTPTGDPPTSTTEPTTSSTEPTTSTSTPTGTTTSTDETAAAPGPTSDGPQVTVTITEEPEEPGRVTVTWVPSEVDVIVRLERRDEDGEWRPVGEPDHRHVAPGDEPTATWGDLTPGRYRAVIEFDDGDGPADDRPPDP